MPPGATVPGAPTAPMTNAEPFHCAEYEPPASRSPGARATRPPPDIFSNGKLPVLLTFSVVAPVLGYPDVKLTTLPNVPVLKLFGYVVATVCALADPVDGTTPTKNGGMSCALPFAAALLFTSLPMPAKSASTR